MKAPITPTLIFLLASAGVSSFTIRQVHHSTTLFTTLRQKTTLLSSSSAPASSSATKQGIDRFEKWWSNVSSSSSTLPVRHALFENNQLRGLEFLSGADVSEKENNVVKVPRDVVLRTPFKAGEWDVNLAVMLLRECQLGEESDIFGYTSLLARGAVPSSRSLPSTAPDALRHWTPDQKSLLASSPSGRKLLELEEKQGRDWLEKYGRLTDASISEESFLWAMEAVHSRAFKGDFGSGKGTNLGTIAFQTLASLLGAKTVLDGGNDLVALGCGVAAAIPLIVSTVLKSEGDAVLLPLIDSANHLQEADSTIEFDPVGNEFVLTIGEKCLVADGSSGKTQMLISYGVKKDEELLLNYGFLRGISDEDEGVRREKMANEFIRRNP